MHRHARAVVVSCTLFAVALSTATADAQTLGGIVRRVAAITSCGSTTCSGSAPTSSTDGTSLQQATAIRVRLCAGAGQTLSGAGTLAVYVRDETDGLWARVAALDKTVPASASGLRCIGWDESVNGVPYGSVAYVPASVTVSGGNLTVTTYISTTRK